MLEAIVLAGMGIAGFLAARRVMKVVAEIETRSGEADTTRVMNKRKTQNAEPERTI